jgi:hypothetical protein
MIVDYDTVEVQLDIPTQEDRINSLAWRVDGWLYEDEGRALYRLARNCTGAGLIVEVGSWKGKSTIYLAGGSRDGLGGLVYAIDHHIGSEEHQNRVEVKQSFGTLPIFHRNIFAAGMEAYVIPMAFKSVDAAQLLAGKPIEVLFLDAAHDYQSAADDLMAWGPMVIPGGWLAAHDYGNKYYPGVKQATDEVLPKLGRFRKLADVNTLAIYQRVEE